MILDNVRFPKDLKELNASQLATLSLEIRAKIVKVTFETGGHLGSSLGAVDFIVALHKVFDAPIDKFVFDVGHQAYSHKIITGRKEQFPTLRQKDGVAGFIDPDESEYDTVISGHASTSISSAIGLARARDLKKDDYKIVSIIGDGSLSGGMVYEAFNNLAGLKDFIIILNDNQMSISNSVGSMRGYLNKLLGNRRVLSIRRNFSDFIDKMPRSLGAKVEKFIKNSLGIFTGGTIFEELGMQYVGPIDGHNMSELIETLQNVRDVANYKPVLVHIITKKGYGHKPAEDDATNMHGLDFGARNKFTNVFERKIVDIAKNDEKVVCVTAAMTSGCGLSSFANNFPYRFFDVGIAEEHAVTFAAGLAKGGFKPFVCFYSTFLQRSFDQIFHDVFLANLPVRFIIDKAGFPGGDGKTHAGMYDISIFNNFNTPVLSPVDASDLERMLEFVTNHEQGPIAIRYPKDIADDHLLLDYDFKLGQHRFVTIGQDILIITFGRILKNVLDAAPIIREHADNYNPTILDLGSINPIDSTLLINTIKKYKSVYVVDEGVFDGLSSAICESLNTSPELLNKLTFITAPKTRIPHMSRSEQLDAASLSPKKIADTILKNRARK